MSATTPFVNAQLRLEQVRRRYFEHGETPALDAVPGAILASWQRCLAAGADPRHQPETPGVSRRRMRATQQANAALLDAARPDLERLQLLLGATPVAAVLTNAAGVVTHATTRQDTDLPLLRRVARIGMDLSEPQVGTGTPGLVSLTGQACVVRGAEHFFHSARRMYCAAAPLRDTAGRLAGGLSLFSESGPFAFDAAAIVAAYAASIEARLLRADPGDVLLVQLAANPLALDTPAEGLVGVAGDGRIAWLNAAAGALFGAAAAAGHACPLELRDLTALVGAPGARLLHLPNGLGVWARASFPRGAAHAPGIATPEPAVPATAADLPAAVETAVTLKAADARLIETALAAHEGNVSRAARALGVSRGRIYRYLRRREGG